MITRGVPGISTLGKITETAKGSGAILAISANTILLCLMLYVFLLGRLLAPTDRIRNAVRRIMARVAETWISINNAILSLYRRTHWDIELPDGLDRGGTYLVSSNHRSWVDILVLQRCFNRRLPLLRFFIKKELIRVPFLGLAWWALDFPFMRRDSKEALARNPSLQGRDLENARKACEKLRGIPVSMMNFPEGTRFTPAKRARWKSPYENLLIPRIGGIGQVLYALDQQLDALIDVTIVYPQAAREGRGPTFWDLLTGKVSAIVARARRLEIPQHLKGRNFRTDPNFRRDLEDWVDRLWREKDALIGQLLNGPAAGHVASAAI